MSEKQTQADRLAKLTDLQRVEMMIDLLAEFCATIECTFPNEATYIPRALIGAALTRVSGEHGSEIAIRVLRDIVDELESGTPGDEAPSRRLIQGSQCTKLDVYRSPPRYQRVACGILAARVGLRGVRVFIYSEE